MNSDQSPLPDRRSSHPGAGGLNKCAFSAPGALVDSFPVGAFPSTYPRFPHRATPYFLDETLHLHLHLTGVARSLVFASLSYSTLSEEPRAVEYPRAK